MATILTRTKLLHYFGFGGHPQGPVPPTYGSAPGWKTVFLWSYYPIELEAVLFEGCYKILSGKGVANRSHGIQNATGSLHQCTVTQLSSYNTEKTCIRK